MSVNPTPLPWRVMTLRFFAFLALWVVMAGWGLANILPGIAAALLAAWCSVALMPAEPVPTRIRPLLMLGMLLRFVGGAVLAGLDVARRAFSPAMPLDPGFLVYRSRLPRGMPRNLFMSIASLIPGTLCTGTDESGGLIFHCLDVGQPVASQLADEEARQASALGVELLSVTPQGPEPEPRRPAA